MDENDLLKFWKEFIDRDIYRVTSEEYLHEILENGLNPKNDPFSKMYGDIDELFQIIIRFEKEGIIYQEEWRDGPVMASEIIKFNESSRQNNYLDFVTDYNQALKFYDKWKGGALTNVVYNFSTFLQNQNLNEDDKELVDKMKDWSTNKRNYKNKIISVKGSNHVFENAKMLCLPENGERKIVESPYGSFDHFKKTVSGKFDLYKPFLKIKKLSYLRVTENIAPDLIQIVL